jgi:4-hydroxy-2-oxoheptanedioate aldolase
MGNKLKEIWRAGGVALNGWLNIPSGFSAEVMAHAGWDSVTIDLQHGVHDYMSMVACFQAMQPHGVVPIVRVPSNEPGIIGKALDAGAYAVICPMLDTAEQVQSFVNACKYPPQGARSNGPVRAGLYVPAGTYQKTANDEVLCVPMIETREALRNIEAIVEVPGVDALYVGPSDLGFSLGLPPMLDREEPQMLEAYRRILAAAEKAGKPVCIHCASAAYAVRAFEMGFKLATVSWDSAYITNGARAAISHVRENIQAARR